jgi:3-deoxy-manno-octulosonate cytidylyltransferase (CMP-KDO synthetase)
MNILGIIPSRYASTRFPGKPLADIDGKTMIRRVYEQAIKARSFSKIIVATDDLRILEHVESFGGNVMMTSGKHASGTDRCGEVNQTLPDDYDIAVNIQGDEPFIQPGQLEKLITAFTDQEIQIATLAIRMKNEEDILNTNIVKVVFGKINEKGSPASALYFSRSAIPCNRDEDPETVYYKHIGIYAFRTDTLEHIITLPQGRLEKAESLEQLRWLENGFKIHVVETDMDTTGIDTPEDLNKI